MIYNYERVGLMEAPTKTEGGTRLYTDRDLDRLVLIKRLQKEFGGSLDETKAALTTVKDPTELQKDRQKLRKFIQEQSRSGARGLPNSFQPAPSAFAISKVPLRNRTMSSIKATNAE